MLNGADDAAVLRRVFRRAAKDGKDALWTCALICAADRDRARLVLTHSLAEAWRRCLDEHRGAPVDIARIRTLQFTVVAETGLRMAPLVGATAAAPSGEPLLDSIRRLHAALEPREIAALALADYSPVPEADIAALAGVPAPGFTAWITGVRVRANGAGPVTGPPDPGASSSGPGTAGT